MISKMDSTFKKITSIDDWLALQLDRFLEEINLPEGVHTTLIQNVFQKVTSSATIDR